MKLRNTPPSPVLSGLAMLGVSPLTLRISVPGDADAEVNSAWPVWRSWLAATPDQLFVFDSRAGERPVARYQLREIADFQCVPALGSGLLQIRIENHWIDLLRYNNRFRFTFERALQRLRELREGNPESHPLESQEIAEPRDPLRCPSCDLPLEFPGELCPRCIDHGAALGRILALLRPYWRPASLLMVLLFFGIALDMIWPMLTRFLVDHVLAGPEAQGTGPFAGIPASRLLVLVVCALAGVHVVRGVVTLFTAWLSSQVGNALTYDIRAKLVKKLEELGLSFYGKQETGSLVGRVAYDTEAVQSFISQITSGFVMQIFLVLSSFVLMFSLSPTLALWTLLPTPLVLGGAVLYWRYVHPRFQKHWDRSARQAGVLSGLLSGIRVVKAFGQEEKEHNRFQASSARVRASREALDRTAGYFYPLMAVVFQAGGWLVWYAGGRDVLEGRLTLGTLMAFFGYLGMFYGPLGNLTNLTTWLTQFSTQVHRIFEILDAPAVLPEASEPVRPERKSGDIAFRDVTFGYTPGVPVLQNISLSIPAGSRIGVVGRSGSGKTSFLNLICRFYDPEKGQILIDGVDLRQIPRDELRSRISLVLQEPFLFKGTLTDNIRFGRPAAALEDVIAATREASAHEFILRHPLAYETTVGERGSELSGGERQRISIARALLCRPPILLLDEATSSVDTESELAIRTALDDLARDRTTITIAHRLSTLQNCDLIYVIDGGRVAEAGTHAELLRQGGHYARWVRMQQGQQESKPGDAEAEQELARQVQEQLLLRSAPTAKDQLPPIAGHRTRWLRPDLDRIETGPGGELQLAVAGERVYRGLHALRCFPVSHPEEYISVRMTHLDGRTQEVALLKALNDWPEEARRLIRESLDRRCHFRTIDRIYSVRRFARFFSISVRTQGDDTRGARHEFIIKDSPEAARDYGDRGKLILDVENNHYLIPDLKALPRMDQTVFDRNIYW